MVRLVMTFYMTFGARNCCLTMKNGQLGSGRFPTRIEGDLPEEYIVHINKLK